MSQNGISTTAALLGERFLKALIPVFEVKDVFQKTSSDTDSGDLCLGAQFVRLRAGPEHNHNNHAKSGDVAAAIAEHDDNDVFAGPAAEPDHADDAHNHEVEASSPEDDAADRLDHDHRESGAELFQHHDDDDAISAAVAGKPIARTPTQPSSEWAFLHHNER